MGQHSTTLCFFMSYRSYIADKQLSLLRSVEGVFWAIDFIYA